MNRIHFLRAVWSDIIVVESGGRFAMIDTGFEEAFPRIRDYLEELGAERLEFILLTHFHRDHYGSLPQLLKHFPVETVYLKPFSGLNNTRSDGRAADERSNREELERCEAMAHLAEERSTLVRLDGSLERIAMGDFDFRLFGTADAIREMYEDPASPYYQQICFNENMNSVALFADVKGTGLYLGGDAGDGPLEWPAFSRRNTRYARAVGRQVSVLKAPHHLCGNIFGEEFLTVLKPQFVVATNYRATIDGQMRANRDLLLSCCPGVKLLISDECGYRFTFHDDGEVSWEEFGRLPAVHVVKESARLYFVREGVRIGEAAVQDQELTDYRVYEPFRGEGTGHHCYMALERYLRTNGFSALRVRGRTEDLVRFWKALGFVEDGETLSKDLTLNESGMP